MILFVAASAAVAFLLWHVSKDLPDYEVLAKYEPPVMTRIHASDGSLIAEYATERRIYVPINAIPEKLIQAFMAAEDKNFFQHGGIDFQGIARAALTNLNNLKSGRRLVGASTITQQVAKNFLLTSDVTFERKIKEAILAIRIERAFTKEQILELYLNEIFFGLKSYGVAAAGLNYWGKALNELNLSDVAYLAALPKAPNNYHPFRHTKRALARRNWVIDRMVENGYVTQEEAEAAKAQPLNVNPRPLGAHIFAAEFFAEEVRRELENTYGRDRLYGGGLSVRATLDPVLQREARKALVDGLVAYDRRHGWRGPVQTIDPAGDWGVTLGKIKVPSDIGDWRLSVVLKSENGQVTVGLRPNKLSSGKLEEAREGGIITYDNLKWIRPRSKKAPLKVGDVVYVAPAVDKEGKAITGQWQLMQVPAVEGALVAMDPHTGRVLAIAGGFSFDSSEFDRATQAQRQPGSSFKPIVYAAALDNGYTPASVVLDAPFCLEAARGRPRWCPENYSKKFYGPSTLRRGIESSRNLMTVRLAQDLGMPLVAEYARRFGVYDNLLPVLPMALGAGETTLMKMITAYSVFANGGKKVTATLIDRIQDRYGRTIWRHDTRDCHDCRTRSWDGQEEPVLTDDRNHIIDPHTAYQITSMMEGVVQRGTAQKIKAVGKPMAGKTGTTNDYKDAWFVGFGPDLAVGVFIGFDQPRRMGRDATGGGVAAPVFRDFMIEATKGQPAIPFRIPPGLQLVQISRSTGFRAPASDPRAILEAFKPGTEPPRFVRAPAPPPQPRGGGGGGWFTRPSAGGLY
ncbi:MAG: penicillin-binding protein 1A [Hyphomicrobiaceae bacterium]|nr:penicillin-binding protein 1A [Hyphomicrobiaceae bacterium]